MTWLEKAALVFSEAHWGELVLLFGSFAFMAGVSLLGAKMGIRRIWSRQGKRRGRIDW